jgi:GNAT superfamily N-acetyltransferase
MISSSSGPADDRADLLRTYDDLLRTEAEMRGTLRWDRDGPLFRAVFAGGSGFVTYRDLAGYDSPADAERLDALIHRTVAHFEQAPDVESFEWKTRGHDRPADLGGRLEAHGLVPGEPETVMLGEAARLAADVSLPAEVVVRRVGVGERGEPVAREVLLADVERIQAMQVAVFAEPAHTPAAVMVDQLIDPNGRVELWVAEAPGDDGAAEVLSAGRLDVVPGTGCAGLWGGATTPAWRGRGLYRALVAARARSALAMGVRLLHSDCTEHSRPILERAGLVAVTTTTPYVGTRGPVGGRA